MLTCRVMDRPLLLAAPAALLIASAWPRVCEAQGDAALSADHVRVDLDSSLVEAEGNVQIVSPPLLVLAESAALDMESGTLVLHGALLRLALPACPVSIEADRADVDAGHAVIEEGTVSLCSCDPPPWDLLFGRLVMDLEGDLTIRRGWLRLGGRRVLPIPWLLVRTGRKVGLLPPRLGWHGSRGFLLGLGAVFPFARTWDLLVTADWIAADGLALGGAIESPGSGLATALYLDPAREGLSSGWIAGSLHAGSGRQHMGLVVDAPVTGRLPRGDMQGVDGASARLALQSLSVRLDPGVGHMSMLGEVSAALALQPFSMADGWTALAPAGTWARVPAVTLSLMPTRILGRGLPVLLGGEIHHVQLLPLGGTTGSRLEASGADLRLSGLWRPGHVVDLGVHASWHGALLRHGEDLEPALWMQSAAAGADASITLMSRPSAQGLAHRLDLAISYRGALRRVGVHWDGPAALFVPISLPAHLAGLVVRNALVRVRGELLALETGAWLVPGASATPLAILSVGLDAGSGPLRLGVRVDLPSDGWAPSLVRSSLALSGAGLVLDIAHLYLSRPAATSLDVDAWLCGRLGVGLPQGRAGAVHAAVIGIGVPLAGGLALGGRAGVDLASGGAPWLEGSVAYTHPCGCLTVRLTALHRASVPAPDILLTLGM